jgi:hypothetical protein
MALLQIQVADELKSRLEARAAESGFDSVESYLEALMRADLEASTPDDDDVEQLLLHRLDSGPGIEVTPQFEEQFRREVRERRASNGKRA